MIQAGPLVIDRERFLVTVNGTQVRLTYLEFNTLWAIAEQEGRVVPYDRLAEALWDGPTPDARRRLAVIISRVRAKLGEEAHAIDTVTRVGYRLAPSFA